jgi:hypothetical protein
VHSTSPPVPSSNEFPSTRPTAANGRRATATAVPSSFPLGVT